MPLAVSAPRCGGGARSNGGGRLRLERSRQADSRGRCGQSGQRRTPVGSRSCVGRTTTNMMPMMSNHHTVVHGGQPFGQGLHLGVLYFMMICARETIDAAGACALACGSSLINAHQRRMLLALFLNSRIPEELQTMSRTVCISRSTMSRTVCISQ